MLLTMSSILLLVPRAATRLAASAAIEATAAGPSTSSGGSCSSSVGGGSAAIVTIGVCRFSNYEEEGASTLESFCCVFKQAEEQRWGGAESTEVALHPRQLCLHYARQSSAR